MLKMPLGIDFGANLGIFGKGGNWKKKRGILVKNLGKWVFDTCSYLLILFSGLMDEGLTNEI